MGKIILGIDPGTLRTGVGLVDDRAGDLFCVQHEVIVPPPKGTLAQRLLFLGDNLRGVIEKYQPVAAVLEKTFLAKNFDSVTKLGHARGVCMYEVARSGIPLFEYNPTEVKLHITGYGRAEKEQVQLLVSQILKMKNPQFKSGFDSSDALALAIYHSRIHETRRKMREREITL